MNTTNNMITSNEHFIATIIPQLETIIPDHLRDGVLPYPVGIYVDKNNGEYLCDLLDTVSNGELQSSALDDSSLALMALYFGNENGEHQFSLLDVECVPSDSKEVGPY